MKNLKVLLPGGAGYIGSVLTQVLLDKGLRVHVIDSLIFEQSTPLAHLRNPNFKFTFGDIRDKALMKESLKDSDVIIPLAALVGAPLCDKHPKLAEEINLQAPSDMFKEVSTDQMLLMPTTNSAYGGGNSGLHCNETSPLNPISTYAQHKVKLESLLMQAPNAISFRLATVFGVSPRMRLDLLVNDFTFRALRDSKLEIFEGHFKRNYIHILDVTRVFVHAIDNFDSMKGEIFNVGLSEANLSKLELCSLIKKHIPLEIIENSNSKDPDQRNYVVSNEKIEKTGFKPHFSLDDGIQEIKKAFPMLNSNMTNISKNRLDAH